MTGDAAETRQRVYTFAEEDYRFGAGSLRMTVERIDWSKPFLQDGERWFEVVGVEMTWDDRPVGRRQALIRGSRLAGMGRP